MTNPEREAFVDKCLDIWNAADPSVEPITKVWGTVVHTMEYVGGKDWDGADKKKEVVEVLRIVLDKTDIDGPDLIVDKLVLWLAEYGIDFLYDAFKGRFKFDGEQA